MPARFCVRCPAIHQGPGVICPTCRATAATARDTQRGTRQQRGYDANHDQLRAQLIAAFQPGQPCAHCGQPMHSADRLDLAHNQDRTGYRGLAHAACNRGNR